jgi:hypothetical protein
VPQAPLIGYGAVNEVSLAAAVHVLEGHALLPVRTAEDDFFALDAAVRGVVFTGA